MKGKKNDPAVAKKEPAAAKKEPSTELSMDLVRRIQDGDRSAWEALYLRYRDSLLFSIRCRLGPRLRSRLQSEDVLHSVVKDVMADIAAFEPRGRGSLKHYLHACLLNKIRSKAHYYAALKRQGEIPLSDSILQRIPNRRDRTPGYADTERFGKLERAVALLPEKMREVILLRRIENLTNGEAAEALGKTPEATSKLYNRALARLGQIVAAGVDT
jgi:RNA polymerase sigma factor (sigma-70 family)